MKLFRTVLAIFFLFGFGSYAFAEDSVKMGVVNMERFQEKSKVFQKQKEKLKLKYDDFQGKLDKEKAELVKMEEEFKKQSLMLSLDAKEDRQKELEKKQRHYKYLAEEYTREMKQAEMEARKKIGKEVGKIVEEIGKKDGYTMIFEKRTVGLIYNGGASDLSDEVAEVYDASKQ